MANNITIQFGTGLAKNTIFSALRQKLIRRLTNCSTEIDWDERLEVMKQYVKLLVNSGHKFAFIKSVTLQAITRYKYMLMRSRLQPSYERYRPLYRARKFDHIKRKVSKMVEHMTWFRGIETYDRFRNSWKLKLKSRSGLHYKKGEFREKVECPPEEEREIVASMFVLLSVESRLMKYIEEEEGKMV